MISDQPANRQESARIRRINPLFNFPVLEQAMNLVYTLSSPPLKTMLTFMLFADAPTLLTKKQLWRATYPKYDCNDEK